MDRIALITTGSTADIDATQALATSSSRYWPEVDVKVLVSSRVVPPPTHLDATPIQDVHGTDFVVSRILPEVDQLALGLPSFLKGLLEHYETCVFIGPGMVVVRPPAELIHQAQATGTAVSVPVTVTPRHSLTPALGPIDAGPFLPEPRILGVTRDAGPFLDEWADTLRQAVLEPDQRPLSWVSETFLRRTLSRASVSVEGQGTLLNWPEYAAVEAGRVTGTNASIVACDYLFDAARDSDLYDHPEVAWGMLVHKVHDSRPVEPLIEIIRASQWIREGYNEETAFDHLRAAIRRAADPTGLKWGPEEVASFDAWLFEENEAGTTRLADLLVKSDPALQQRFFGVRFDPVPFRRWVGERGRLELGFDPLDRDYPAREPETSEIDVRRLRNAIGWRWNTIKTLVPGYTTRATKKVQAAFLGPDPGETRGVAPPRPVHVTRTTPMWGSSPRGLNLLGPFRSESGLGQAARASLEAIRLLDLPFTHVDTTEKYPSRNSVDVGLTFATHGQIGDVNLIHSNAEEMLTLSGGVFKHRFGGRFNAAMWFWETADLPLRARAAFHLVDELWVASNYQRDVFGQYASVPIHVVGLAADLPERRVVDRTGFGWKEDDLVFLFVYDALSSYGRKNPVKALQAFISAFAPGFEDVRFVLKVSNLNKFPASQKEILGLAGKYPAITVIDEYLSRDDVMDLMSASDVYVSLHAAEGFGLTLLEAMALGTPVICTGYSGNMDFTNDANSWLVGYDMMKTEEQTGPYPKGSVWGSPRLTDAIEIMRRIGDNRSEIASKAEAAYRDALSAASLESYASRLQEHLRRVL